MSREKKGKEESEMSGNLEELAREEERAYKKAWRAANRDKVRTYNSNYWKRRAEKKQTEQKRGRLNNG